ncbi:protein xpaC [Oceanobacillus chungangensis]|uniref:Protein xpaC n=2 Tax=Oceanobacillus chungangensis TaxID=1229152 RepID=A0A3D8PJR1_9BACI|nr:protein xpaC [Oceanobacillus chungangensis]
MLRGTVAFIATVATWLISFFTFEQTYLLSSLFAIIGGVVVYYSVKQMTKFSYLRRIGLSKREYKFIDNNLQEAKNKISRLNKALLSIRSIDQARQNFEIIRTVKKIYSNTKKEPKRFYQAEGFYYNHLDSLVELAEKFAFLSSQPVKNREMMEALRDTRITIAILGETVKKDLYIMLDDDIDTLHYELDVAKRSISKSKKNDWRVLK